MKLLIYTHFFPPSTGGVETYARLLASGFSGRAAGVGVETIEVTVATRTPAAPEFDTSFPFRIVRRPSWLRLLQLIRGATVVQLSGPSLLPMFLALLLRKPLIIEQHGYQAACPNGLLLYEPSKHVCPSHFLGRRYRKCFRCNRQFLGWWASLKMLVLTFPRRWLCQQSDANVAVTSHVARRLDLPRTRVIYHGLPDLLNRHPGCDIAMGNDSGPLCFAYVGRLVSEKGLHLLIEAARKLRDQGFDFRLKVVGDGPERSTLEAAVAQSGLQGRVLFTGFLDGRELEDALQDVTVVVLPSLWEETAGLAAIEQMFRGRLVIASKIGGLEEVIGTAGLQFSPGDVEALTDCMKQVIEKPDVVSQLGHQARQRALQCFGFERMLDEHLATYHELINGR